MADPTAIVPYHDPYDGAYGDEITEFISYPDPGLLDLSLTDGEGIGPTSHSSSVAQNIDQISDVNNLFDDPVMWDFPAEPNAGDGQAGPSGVFQDTGTGGQKNWQPENLDYENSMLLSVWPPPPVLFGCSCCQVLREIIHTNGRSVTRLEIHGRLGLICHAILEIQQIDSLVSQNNQYQMFDFCKKSIEEVKQFLVKYCLDRKQAGFLMVQDPLSFFYEALCVGLDWDEHMDNDELNPSFSSNSETQKNDQPGNTNDPQTTPKTSLAAQRERTGKLTIKDVGNYFHLPIEEAAKKMKLCPTVVKKICRRDGLSRWPHRKIKSIERRIATWKPSLSSSNAEERARAEAEIQRLQQEIDKIRAQAA